ncbi:voltage-gated potassium channel protein [Alcaligenaceae bacterium CGII-47]|nr:voltage-gated potassium channel protein [Alcaligenaceae bacterium CGII-47]
MTVHVRAFLLRIFRNFPYHWLFAVLVALDGYLFLQPGLNALSGSQPETWLEWFDRAHLTIFLQAGGATELSRLVLGVGVQVMALGLLYRARIAWVMSVCMLALLGSFVFWQDEGQFGLAIYSLVLVVLLAGYWRQFDRSSLAAGGLFALLSVGGLLVYAVFGALYLGEEFQPQIDDVVTAFYFSIVSMSTVGYGDITPQTGASRLFTASIIILGITVFATSISAIVGPMIGGNIKRLMKGRITHNMRKNHIIIAGVTPLAQSVYTALRERGHEVAVIVPADVVHAYPPDADLMVGDASNTAVLEQMGVAQARYVLALRTDDAENAFIVMATREVGGPQTRTVALANSSTHLPKIKRVGPDIVISLQLLGSEILARTLSGESIDGDLITRLLFGENGGGQPPLGAAQSPPANAS